MIFRKYLNILTIFLWLLIKISSKEPTNLGKSGNDIFACGFHTDPNTCYNIKSSLFQQCKLVETNGKGEKKEGCSNQYIPSSKSQELTNTKEFKAYNKEYAGYFIYHENDPIDEIRTKFEYTCKDGKIYLDWGYD